MWKPTLVLSISLFTLSTNGLGQALSIAGGTTVAKQEYCRDGLGATHMMLTLKIRIVNGGRKTVHLDSLHDPGAFSIARTLSDLDAGKYEMNFQLDVTDPGENLSRDALDVMLQPGESTELIRHTGIPIRGTSLGAVGGGNQYLKMVSDMLVFHDGRYTSYPLQLGPVQIDVSVPPTLPDCESRELAPK